MKAIPFLQPALPPVLLIQLLCIQDRSTQHTSFPQNALYAPGNIFASVGTQATVGVSSYNSMQVSLRKSFTHGLAFQASYTYSHSIDDTSGFENSGFGQRAEDPFNFALSRGDSAFDARQRFVVNYDYEIPHLSRYWSNMVVRTVLDGWHVAGITTFQTGFPINIADTGFAHCNAMNTHFTDAGTPPTRSALPKSPIPEIPLSLTTFWELARPTTITTSIPTRFL